MQRNFIIIKMDIVNLSKQLMYEQTKKNKAPSWLLTKLAIEKGVELSKLHNVDEKLVLVSLYLAHTKFSPIWHGGTQQNHPELSSSFIKEYLDKWEISKNEQEIILNSIESHHNKIKTKSKIAEVVKNAECFKFLTIEGSLILLHELGLRGFPFNESVEKVIQKMEQKLNLLTLDDCKKEANKNCNKIIKLFN
jgi:methionine synthase II (cobalamin-independent)